MCKCPNYIVCDGRTTNILPVKSKKGYKEKYIFLGHRTYDYMLTIKNPWIQVPCGQCLECRIQSARTWADRCVLEAKDSHYNFFVTLTYDDDSYPVNGSLSKRDYQLFIKRLRKRFPDIKIRYLLCGEYGDQTLRPHYHMILFNCPLDDLSTQFKVRENGRLVTRSKPNNNNLFYSKLIHECWQYKGMISVGYFSYDTAAYISQYVTKKVNPKNKVMYEKLGLVPEFLAMSNGIAKKFAEDKDDLLYSLDKIVIAEGGSAHLSSVPRYFDKKFIEKYGEDVFSTIRHHRISKKLQNQNNYLHSNRFYDKDCEARDYRLNKMQKLKTQI